MRFMCSINRGCCRLCIVKHGCASFGFMGLCDIEREKLDGDIGNAWIFDFHIDNPLPRLMKRRSGGHIYQCIALASSSGWTSDKIHIQRSRGICLLFIHLECTNMRSSEWKSS